MAIEGTGRVDERGEPLRSVEHPGSRVSLVYRRGDVDVMVVEIGAHGSLSDTALGGEASWHLVMDGRARFERDGQDWEVLPSHSLALPGTGPYRIVNLGDGRLRLLSIVASPGVFEADA